MQKKVQYGHDPRLSAKELRENIQDKLDEAQTIFDKAGDRELTDDENAAVDAIMAKVGDPGRNGHEKTGMYRQVEIAEQRETARDPAKTTGQRYINRATGQPVYCLSKDESMANLYSGEGGDDEPSLGRGIQAAITGRWKDAPEEFRMAQSEGANSAGGFLVPEQLTARVIDKGRATSVCVRAGAQTFVMDSDTLRIARVHTDPSFEVKTENAAFTSTEAVFDSVNFTAHTIGNYILASRELAEDAPNFGQLIEQTLANALAAELDRQFLQGDASAELLGLINDGSARTTASVGAIAWEDLATGVVDLWGQNVMPNAYIVSPTIAGDLDALTSGDGSTSAKLWLPAPPPVAPLTRFITSNMPDTDIAIGDFTQLAIGLRNEARIEVTTEAANTFEKHQVGIKVVWRGDTNRLRSTAFHILQKITT